MSKGLGVAAILIVVGCLCFGLWAAGPRIMYGIQTLLSPEVTTPPNVEPIDQEKLWKAVNGEPARDM